MPQYWMITDRAFRSGAPTGDVGKLTYWLSNQPTLDQIGNWTSVTAAGFQSELVAAADQFPVVSQGQNAEQKHVCFFVHGYNNGFTDAARRYQELSQRLFSGPESLGICISLDW